MGTVEFVIGGIRSGKSRFAEERAAVWEREGGGSVTYLATSRVRDDEMVARVAMHRSRRPETWNTVEAPTEVAKAVRTSVPGESMILVDCVNMLVSNLLLDVTEAEISARRDAVVGAVLDAVDASLAVLAQRPGPSILISNEVGMAPVALTPLGRVFQDAIGLAHQEVARIAESVYFLVAGLPHRLK